MSSCKTKDFSVESEKTTEPVSHELCNEMTDAQREAIVYRSKLLNKYYESYDDMLREEAEFKRQNEEKERAKAEKTADAKKVEDAYKHLLEVKRQAVKEIEEAEKMYYEQRNAFIEKHGSYHMTYTNTDGRECLSVSDLVDSIWNAFGNPFRLL